MKRKIKLLLKISLLASPALMIYSCSTQNKSVDSDNEIKVFSEKVSKTIDENFSESALSDRVFDYSKANTIHVLANDLKDNPENAETYIPLILMAIAEANGSTKILSLTAIFDQVKFGVSSKNIVSSFVVNEEEKSYMRISGIYWTYKEEKHLMKEIVIKYDNYTYEERVIRSIEQFSYLTLFSDEHILSSFEAVQIINAYNSMNGSSNDIQKLLSLFLTYDVINSYSLTNSAEIKDFFIKDDSNPSQVNSLRPYTFDRATAKIEKAEYFNDEQVDKIIEMSEIKDETGILTTPKIVFSTTRKAVEGIDNSSRTFTIPSLNIKYYKRQAKENSSLELKEAVNSWVQNLNQKNASLSYTSASLLRNSINSAFTGFKDSETFTQDNYNRGSLIIRELQGNYFSLNNKSNSSDFSNFEDIGLIRPGEQYLFDKTQFLYSFDKQSILDEQKISVEEKNKTSWFGMHPDRSSGSLRIPSFVLASSVDVKYTSKTVKAYEYYEFPEILIPYNSGVELQFKKSVEIINSKTEVLEVERSNFDTFLRDYKSMMDSYNLNPNSLANTFDRTIVSLMIMLGIDPKIIAPDINKNGRFIEIKKINTTLPYEFLNYTIDKSSNLWEIIIPKFEVKISSHPLIFDYEINIKVKVL